jgi:hypothetical protein
VQASAGLLILKSRAYSGYPEIFAGNGSFAGEYWKVEFTVELTEKYPWYINRGIVILSTDPTAMTPKPFAGAAM